MRDTSLVLTKVVAVSKGLSTLADGLPMCHKAGRQNHVTSKLQAQLSDDVGRCTKLPLYEFVIVNIVS